MRRFLPRSLCLVTALLGAGCSATQAERDHARAVDALYDGLRDELDALLSQWSAAEGEKNRMAAMVSEGRLHALLADRDKLFAVRVGLKLGDEQVVATCAAAAGFARIPGLGAELVPLLSHGAPTVRSNAAMALALRDGEGCPVSVILRLLGDEDVGVRQGGALLAGRILAQHRDDPDYANALLGYLHALTDVDAYVRAHAAIGLGRLGDLAAAPPLVQRGLQDQKPMVRFAAAQALAALRPEGEVLEIRAAMGREFNKIVKSALNIALVQTTGKRLESDEAWDKYLREEWPRRQGAGGETPVAPPAGPGTAVPGGAPVGGEGAGAPPAGAGEVPGARKPVAPPGDPPPAPPPVDPPKPAEPAKPIEPPAPAEPPK